MVDLAPFFIAKTKHIITFLPPPPLRSTLSPQPHHPPLLHTTSIYDCCLYKYLLYLYYNNMSNPFFIKPHNYNYKKQKYKFKCNKREIHTYRFLVPLSPFALD